ncbi:hypothetical protein ACO0RG_003272 [Hanseniaspora osmophila]
MTTAQETVPTNGGQPAINSVVFETKLIATPQGTKQKILLQNENGPCSLIALTNLLVLSKLHKRYCLDLIDYVNSHETISLQDLVSVLCEAALHLHALEEESEGANPLDIHSLQQKLLSMNNGLMVDPKFDGNFRADASEDLFVFNIFQVSLVHGWCVEPVFDDPQSSILLKYSYEQAQQVLMEAYQLNSEANNVASTDPNYEARKYQVNKEAGYIKPFLARTVRQMTDYGLKHMNDILFDEDYVIFFRNDHFQTLYKQNGELFTLVSDAGYKKESQIVWQSLKSVNGSEDQFFDGNFELANPGDTFQAQQAQQSQQSQQSQKIQQSQQVQTTQPKQGSANDNDNGLTDEELAKILQEEEDAKYADNMQRRIAQKDRRQQSRRERNGQRNNANGNSNGGDSVDEFGNPVASKKSKKKFFKKKSKCIIL